MATDASQQPQGRQSPSPAGYEKRDADARWIFGIVGFLLAAGIAIHVIIAGLIKGMETLPVPSDAWGAGRRSQEQWTSALPRLQVNPPADLRRFRTAEDVQLNTFGWINRTAGVVRIPIDRAMKLVLERGLPVRTGTNGDQLGSTSYDLQQQRSLSTKQETGGGK